MGSLFFCTGTGRTGKTVVAEQLEKKGWIRHKSPTRDFFKNRGITSEGDLFGRSQPERAIIQREYFDFFMEDLDRMSLTYKPRGENTANLIFERGPIDMMAYLVFHDWSMTYREYDNYLDRISSFFEQTDEQGWDNIIGLFPFPPTWAINSKDDDSFRHSMFGKDITIHSILLNIYNEMHDRCQYEFETCLMEDDSIEDRVKHIETFVP